MISSPPLAGKILALFWDADDDVPVLENVAVVGEDGEDTDPFRPEGQASASVAAEPESSAPPHAPAVSQASGEPVVAPAAAPVSIGASSGVSPRARKLATKHGLDPETIQGSGPEGRVIERDIEATLAGRPRLSATARSRSLSEDLEAPARGRIGGYDSFQRPESTRLG